MNVTDEFYRQVRKDFENDVIAIWHKSEVKDLQTWNEAGCFYANLSIQDRFRAYCLGRLRATQQEK